MNKVIAKNWQARRIVLENGGQVAVGIITTDKDDIRTGIRFDRAGEETVRFALSDQAVIALTALLTDPAAGEEWVMPSDMDRMIYEWRLVRDEEVEALVSAIEQADKSS